MLRTDLKFTPIYFPNFTFQVRCVQPCFWAIKANLSFAYLALSTRSMRGGACDPFYRTGWINTVPKIQRSLNSKMLHFYKSRDIC